MMFRGVGWQAAARHAASFVTAALLLTACGGGGAQVERFQPTRLIAFGDETSVIEDNGRKHSVNWATAASAPGDPEVLDCKQLPIWIQTLATAYGLVLPQCNPNAATPSALIQAKADAKSAAVSTQVDAFLAAGNSFGGKDLVTVLAGQNDILEQYNAVQAGTVTSDAAVATLEAAGTALAGQVNRIGRAGGKVIISTVPDMGLTPFAVAQGTTQAALLSRLTARFNSKLRVGLLNDGRMIGLVLMDETVQLIVKGGSMVSSDPACASTPILPNCSTLTLNTTTTATMPTAPTPTTVGNWLWSDTTHLGVGGHSALGSAALTRASNNPF
jgi:hypothetical protein